MTAMTVIHLIAYGLSAVAGRAGWVYLKPYKRCWWCKDKPGRNYCWSCHGHRHVRRLGARFLHRGRLAAADAWNERKGQ